MPRVIFGERRGASTTTGYVETTDSYVNKDRASLLRIYFSLKQLWRRRWETDCGGYGRNGWVLMVINSPKQSWGISMMHWMENGALRYFAADGSGDSDVEGCVETKDGWGLGEQLLWRESITVFIRRVAHS
jgi:hypothetical protein